LRHRPFIPYVMYGLERDERMHALRDVLANPALIATLPRTPLNNYLVTLPENIRDQIIAYAEWIVRHEN
jgi:hypothetical protein